MKRFKKRPTNRKEIEELLLTNAKYGLTDRSVQERIKKYGRNVLSEKKRNSIFHTILKNLFDFSTGLLMCAVAISFFVGEIANFIAIFGIVALETILSSIQQYKADNPISSLKGLMVDQARVIRDAEDHIIPAEQLVPGDVIVVEGGEKLPADARLIGCYDLRTTEASLTGESSAVDKCAKECRKNVGITNQNNMLFMGSDVLCGRGKAIVTATGMNTEIGKIAFMLQNIQGTVPPI